MMSNPGQTLITHLTTTTTASTTTTTKATPTTTAPATKNKRLRESQT